MYQETMQSLFNQSLILFKDRIAVQFGETSYTYEQLRRKANRCSHAMVERGMGPGERVALLLPNCIEFIYCDLAIIKAGAGKVAMNDMLGEQEIKYILQDSGAKLAFVGPEFFSIMLNIREELPDLEWIIGIAEPDNCPKGFIPWEMFLEGSDDREQDPDARATADDLSWLAYTGGTTGLPKGVVHSQRNAYLNLCSHSIESGITDDERMLLMTPLTHSAGLFAQTGLLRGATIFMEQRFDPKRALECIEQEKITFTFMVPTMIYRLLDQHQETPYNTASLRTIFYGAAPITVERLKQGLALFGPVFAQLFGQTECPNFVTRLSKSDHSLANLERLRSCGRAVSMVQVRVVDEEGRELPRGEVGEIVCRGPYVMNEYYQLPDKTAETIVAGWLHTGDIGKMDEDGYVYLLDRKKDMIISGGLNVYTTEVENALQKYPKVRQVTVIGIPHADWGETVLALVIPADESVTEEEILTFSRDQLATYKRPKQVKFVQEFPLTPYGKVDKKAFRAPYWEALGRQVN
jgi:fatty-acyl-CoA synthase